MLESIARSCDFDVNTPFKELRPYQQKMLLYGDGENAAKSLLARSSSCKPFEGILPILKRRYDETDSFATQWELEQYMSYQTCPDCRAAGCAKNPRDQSGGQKHP